MLNFVEVDILPVDYLAQSTQMAKAYVYDSKHHWTFQDGYKRD